MRRLNPTLLALLGGVAVLILIIVYFATNRSSEQDRLTGNLVSNEVKQTAAPSGEKRCTSNATFDLIKRELFRRAAQLRGKDQAAYDQIAGFAVLRMDDAVAEGEDAATGAVNCSGSVSLDLPPGVVMTNGRRTLMANIDYAVDAYGGVTLHRADAVIAPLATLSRTAQPPPPAPTDMNGVAPESPGGNVAASQSANVRPGPPSAYPGRPSFDCTKPLNRSETIVCSDPGLSALDLNMATQYHRALSTASPAEQTLLMQTGRRFYLYRDRCPDRTCIADAYLGRMREIHDILEGRAPR